MSDKRLTVILYGCDRAIWRGGPVDLRIVDIFAAGGPRPLYEGRSEEATIDLRLQLPFDAGQVYGFTFSAPDHRPAWQLVRRAEFIRAAEQVEVDDVILRLMLMPDSPGTSDLPNAFERIRQIGSPFAARQAASRRKRSTRWLSRRRWRFSTSRRSCEKRRSTAPP